MTMGPRTRTRGLAAVAVLATAAWLMLRTAGDGPPAGRSAATSPDRGDEPARGAALRVFPDPHAEDLPGVHCWDGLLDLDRAGSLAELRAALARAVASGDDLLASYVGDRLVEVIGDDVDRASTLLDWADAAHGKELEVLLGALARTAAAQAPAIAQRLLRTGEDPAGDELRRVLALTALDTQRALPHDAIGRLHAVATERDGGAAAWTATRTLGRVMKTDFAQTGSYAPYWDQLLDISRTSGDHAVRLLALEMPAYADAVLDDAYIDDLAAVLTTAPEPEVREMAAFQLGLTEDPDRVLEVFRAAFPREPTLCVRWAIVRFAVRAGGPRALPLLDDLVAIDPRFAVDLADFRRLYESGLHDYERIWLDKAEHHPCSADGDAHEGGA